jgi:hypothetical protein
MIYYIVKNRMTKFTRKQSRQIDQAVKETIVKRWTYLEALDYIKASLGYSYF